MIRLSIAQLSFSILGYNEEKFLYFSLLTHYIIKFYQIPSAKSSHQHALSIIPENAKYALGSQRSDIKTSCNVDTFLTFTVSDLFVENKANTWKKL